MQKAAFKARKDSISLAAPVLIVGNWRSGTTLLHELMCLDSRFAFASTGACMYPQYFLFDPAARGDEAPLRVKRPMDDMFVTASSPQEAEFALLCLGAPSPYEAFLFPSDLASLVRNSSLEHLPAAEQAEWEQIFIGFLRAVGIGAGGKRLLLKSPTHSFRIAVLKRLFPEARFLHIVRNPVHVYASMIRMLREMTALYGIGSLATDDEIADAALHTIPATESAIGQAAASLEIGRYHQLKFEALIDDPGGTVAAVYEGLHLGDAGEMRRIVDEEMSRWGRRGNAPPVLSPAERLRIAQHCGAIMDKYGYRN